MIALSKLPRALGVLTAAYGTATLVRPQLLAEPCALTEENGDIATPVAVLSRAIGARDLVSGLTVAVAPDGKPLRWAVAIRAMSDFADASLFGLSLPDKQARAKAAVVAGLWGVLCAVSAATTHSRDR